MSEKANRGKGLDVRRKEAEVRNSKWAALSFKDQLKTLEKNGFSHTRQFKRIETKLADEAVKSTEKKKVKKSNKKGSKK
jgi:hypothetical protein